MGQDAYSAVFALQDSHQATGVIIVPLAEADEIEMAEEVEVKENEDLHSHHC